MVEGTALETRNPRKRIGGSNPPASAENEIQQTWQPIIILRGCKNIYFMNGKISTKLKANLALLGGGVFFGVSSPLARLMGTWLNPFSVVFIRFLFALPFSIIFFLRGDVKNVPIKKLILFALFLPVSVCLYTFALFHTKVSLAIFSFYIANLISSIIIGYLFNKERVSKNKTVGFILAIVAILIFTNPFHGFVTNTGMILGYLSGITATFASLYQKRLSKTIDEKALTLTQIIGGLVVALVAIIFINDMSILTISARGLLLGVIFGFLFFLINYFMIYGFKYSEIGIGTILLSSELLFGPLAAFIIFKETLSPLEIIGGVVIALAMFFVSKHKD